MANDSKKYLDQTGLEKVWGLTKVLVDNKIDDFKDGLATTATGNGSYIDVEITQAEGKVANVKIDDDKINNAIISGSTLKNDIKILGGPLSDDVSSNWPTDWKNAAGEKVIPKGKTLEQILIGLFFSIKQGTVSWSSNTWSPTVSSPSISLSSSKVEVGSTVKLNSLSAGSVSASSKTFTGNFTSDCGYFKADKTTWSNSTPTVKSTGSAGGSPVLTLKWNGTTVLNPVVGTTTFKVAAGPNTASVSQTGFTASRPACTATTIYASTNTKEIIESRFATISDSAESKKLPEKSASTTVTGAYYFYYGTVAQTNSSGLSITATSIKSLSKTWAATGQLLSSLTIPKNGNTYIVAVPSNYTIKSVLQSGQNVAGSWKNASGGPKQTVTYTLPDNSTTTYNIFYCENDASFDVELTALTIG